MIKSIGVLAAGAAIALGLGGCNVGMGPEGPSPQEFQKQVDSLSPQKQIEHIQGSPMAPAMKAQKIQAIEQKYGIKADAAPTAPGTPAPAGAGTP